MPYLRKMGKTWFLCKSVRSGGKVKQIYVGKFNKVISSLIDDMLNVSRREKESRG